MPGDTRGRAWGGTDGIVACIGSCQRDRPDRDRLTIAYVLVVKRARSRTCHNIASKNATESDRYVRVGIRVVDFVIGYAGCGQRRRGDIRGRVWGGSHGIVACIGSRQRDRPDRDCLTIAYVLVVKRARSRTCHDIASKNATEGDRNVRVGIRVVDFVVGYARCGERRRGDIRGRVWGGSDGIVACVGSCQRDRPDRDCLAVAYVLVVKRARCRTCHDIASKNATESDRYVRVGIRVVDFAVGYARCGERRRGDIRGRVWGGSDGIVACVGSCQRDRPDRDCLTIAYVLVVKRARSRTCHDIASKNATESDRYVRVGIRVVDFVVGYARCG